MEVLHMCICECTMQNVTQNLSMCVVMRVRASPLFLFPCHATLVYYFCYSARDQHCFVFSLYLARSNHLVPLPHSPIHFPPFQTHWGCLFFPTCASFIFLFICRFSLSLLRLHSFLNPFPFTFFPFSYFLFVFSL